MHIRYTSANRSRVRRVLVVKHGLPPVGVSQIHTVVRQHEYGGSDCHRAVCGCRTAG